MGNTPQGKGITIGFDCQFEVRLTDSRLSTILVAFGELLSQMLTDFIQKVLVGFGEHAMALKKKPFVCDRCGNEEDFIWKTKHGKGTKILTIYRWVQLQQMQVLCKECGHKFYITRSLLGIEPNKRIPAETYWELGLMGCLTTYRVAQKIGGMFGWAVEKMTVWCLFSAVYGIFRIRQNMYYGRTKQSEKANNGFMWCLS